MEFSLGLRKGAWMEEEDILLRKCIEKYGEGNWRQVPFRAGLRRCRKSCRLRWLNYLSPNIKRGEFTPDEVDLIIRLHKLLGNRWSLMAGRLPGRTANDIKSYWNTRLKKKFVLGQEVIAKEEVIANTIVVEKTKVIKPKPWIFTKSSPWLKFSADTTTAITTTTTTESREKMVMASPGFPQDDPMPWWDSVYGEKEGEKETSCSISGSREELSSSLWVNDMEDDNNGWDDFCFDGNLWDTLEIE